MNDSHDVTWVQFEPAHLDVIEMRDIEREELDNPRIESLATNSGVCHTHMIQGRILCIAGYVEIWAGVREVYVIPSVYVKRYPVAFQRAVKETLFAWEKDIHRMQTASLDNVETARWMQSLGFVSEGLLEKFGPAPAKRDYRQWARVS